MALMVHACFGANTLCIRIRKTVQYLEVAMHGFLLVMLCLFCLQGCGARGGNDGGAAQDMAQASSPAAGLSDRVNAYNPYMRDALPSLRSASSEGQAMLAHMGGRIPTIEREAAHRPHWKNEIYPVVFGDVRAPHEILVLLDFASPQSEKIWQSVAEAARSLDPRQCKIVVLANSKEYYGTDLMGMAIWISYSRPGQAMPYLTYAMSRWNAVKAAQKKSRGQAARFNNEYDATVNSTDLPIHYSYMSQLRPPVRESDEFSIGKYCYDAGNVNLYQAEQISRFYGAGKLPAVIADGKVLSSVSAASILKAVR